MWHVQVFTRLVVASPSRQPSNLNIIFVLFHYKFYVMIVDVLEYFMGQSELMTPAEFVKMYEKPPQVTLDGG